MLKNYKKKNFFLVFFKVKTVTFIAGDFYKATCYQMHLSGGPLDCAGAGIVT